MPSRSRRAPSVPFSLSLSLSLSLVLAPLAAQAVPDPAPLRAFLGKDAPLPAAAEQRGLLPQLTTLLGARDPALRDDLAYSLLAKWLCVDRVVPVEQRRALLETWLGALVVDPAAPPDAVLRRSFSALALGLLVALDNREPWLTDAEHARLLAAAVDYLRAEGDVRGIVPELGWVHSVAHTADLLKLLARSPRLDAAGTARVLAAIADKLERTDVPLVCGEDERLARAVLAVAARDDFDDGAFAVWLGVVWPAAAGAADAAALARGHNRRHLVTTLHALLAADPRTSPSLEAARQAVGAHLRARLR
jgi:hypothetical protein